MNFGKHIGFLPELFTITTRILKANCYKTKQKTTNKNTYEISTVTCRKTEHNESHSKNVSNDGN